MTKQYYQIIVLILSVVILASCTSPPTPTSSPTAVSATPIVTVVVPTNPLPTATRSATATNPPPTTVPLTEVVETDISQENNANVMETNHMNIQIGDHVLTATLVENSSVEALKEALLKGPITIDMRDYGSMEKVGSLKMDLPRNDEQITTEAGDIILYQGNAFVIYYAPNTWNFTRLGKINNVTAQELREILGEGDVTITLSLPQE